MERFIDTNELGLAVIYAVQGILVLFFVISPISGAIIANRVRKRSTTVIILSAALILFNVVFVGLTYLLQDREMMNDDTALLTGLVTALCVTLFLGGITLWLYRDGPSAIDQELKHIPLSDTNTDFSFQRRRQERLKKRAKRR